MSINFLKRSREEFNQNSIKRQKTESNNLIINQTIEHKIQQMIEHKVQQTTEHKMEAIEEKYKKIINIINEKIINLERKVNKLENINANLTQQLQNAETNTLNKPVYEYYA